MFEGKRHRCHRLYSSLSSLSTFFCFLYLEGVLVVCALTALFLREDFYTLLATRLNCCRCGGGSKDRGNKTSVVPLPDNDGNDGNDGNTSTPKTTRSSGSSGSWKCTGRISVEKLKIMLAYVQIMALFRSNYAIRWPGSVRALFRMMDLFDFNLVQLVALECIHRSTYYFTFLVSLCLPLGFATVLYVMKTMGVWKYEKRLMSIPRTCVVTGQKVTMFMEPKAYHNMRVAATIAALKEAGWGEPTPSQIHHELMESTPLLRPSSSVTPGMEMSTTHGKATRMWVP